jgi:hypothetical protein
MMTKPKSFELLMMVVVAMFLDNNKKKGGGGKEKERKKKEKRKGPMTKTKPSSCVVDFFFHFSQLQATRDYSSNNSWVYAL